MPQSTSKPRKFKFLAIILLAAFAMMVLSEVLLSPESFSSTNFSWPGWKYILVFIFYLISGVFLVTFVFMITSWQFLLGLVSILVLCFLMIWTTEWFFSSMGKRKLGAKWLSLGLTAISFCTVVGYLAGVLEVIANKP